MLEEEEKILRLLRETNTFQEGGHFKLVSGNHSDVYFQVRLALSFDKVADEISKLLADKFKDEKINKVVGFTVGGNILANKISKYLKAKPIFGEKKQESTFSFIDNGQINSGEKILIVEDVLTTENHIIPVINTIKKSTKGKLIGIGVVVDRRVEEKKLGVKIKTLLRTKPNLWSPESCPLCKHRIPLTDYSLPDKDPFSIFLSMPGETQKALIESYMDFLKRTNEEKLFDEIESCYNPQHELPGQKCERIAILGHFRNYTNMQQIAQIVAKFGYYAITAALIYQKDTAKRKGWGPYDYETMNDFLGRMIFSCQYAIIMYSIQGGHFIETMWCSQSNKLTLGIAYITPWDLEKSEGCEFIIKGPESKYIFCDGVQAYRRGSKKVGGYICSSNKDCPFPSSQMSQMILDFYTTCPTMHLVGSDAADNITGVIKNFLENHGNVNLEELCPKVR